MILELLLDKGGLIMMLLLCLSVYVVCVIIYKLLQFYFSRIFVLAPLNAVLEHYRNGQVRKAKSQLTKCETPLANVVAVAIEVLADKKLSDKRQREQISYEAEKQIRPFSSHLRGLEMVANVGPLLGLLGTVIGMVKAFSGIGDIGSRIDPSILASGIWEALLTTVAGLSVAIPALVAHYVIDSRIDKIHEHAHDVISKLWSSHDRA